MSDARQNNPAIGDAGELWFASQLPLGWVWQPPRIDKGKDGLVVVQDRSELHNLEFSIQVKATKNICIKNDAIRYSGIPTSSVLYWFSSPQPTLIIVVDIRNKRGWFSWHLDLFKSPSELSGKKTCSVRIPVENELDSTGWDNIRERLRRHYDGLQNALHTANMAYKIVPAIGSLAMASRDLVWLNNEPDRPNREDFSSDDPRSVFLLVHDQCCYRDILATLNRVIPLFTPGSDLHKQLTFWTKAFQAHVLEAYPTFETFRRAEDVRGQAIKFHARALKPKRQILIAATLDVISMLSS